MKLLRIYVGLSLVFLVGGLLAYLWFPSISPMLLAEDQLIENLTALLCLVAFALCMLALRKRLAWQPPLIATISLLAFLDEISFGARLWGGNGLQNDQGFIVDGVHDLPILLRSWGSRTLLDLKGNIDNSTYQLITLGLKLGLTCLILAVGVGGFIYLFRWFRRRRRLNKSLKTYTSMPFLATAILFVILSQTFDMLELGYQFLSILEELGEMNAALGLLFAGLSLHLEDQQGDRLFSVPAKGDRN
ncbi:MAG TPA: hypothetical protein V6C88_18095 [Chroococcidiopsis sp.]